MKLAIHGNSWFPHIAIFANLQPCLLAKVGNLTPTQTNLSGEYTPVSHQGAELGTIHSVRLGDGGDS